MTEASKAKKIQSQDILKKLGKLAISGAFIGVSLAAATLVYQIYDDRKSERQARLSEAERNRLAAEHHEQVLAELKATRELQKEQLEHLKQQAALEVQQELENVQTELRTKMAPQPETAKDHVGSDEQTLNSPQTEPNGNTLSLPLKPSTPIEQTTVTVFDTLGMNEFELCGHSGFQITQKNGLIRLTNYNRSFEHRTLPAFSMDPWQTDIEPDTITELFPGCSVKASSKESFTTTYFVVSEIFRERT